MGYKPHFERLEFLNKLQEIHRVESYGPVGETHGEMYYFILHECVIFNPAMELIFAYCEKGVYLIQATEKQQIEIRLKFKKP